MNNLHDFLVEVANAIRDKNGSSNLINPQDFPNKIRSIKSSTTNTTDNTLYYRLDALLKEEYGMVVMLLFLSCNVESVIVDLVDTYQGSAVKTTRFKLNSLYYSGRSEQSIHSAINIMYELDSNEQLVAVNINAKDFNLVVNRQNPETLIYEHSVLTLSGSIEDRFIVLLKEFLNMGEGESKQVASTLMETLNSVEITKEEYESLLTN